MVEFYVTIDVSNDEERQSFTVELMKNNMTVRVETQDDGFYHYAIQGNWSGYTHLADIIEKQENTKQEGKYFITSLEHFED
jgi:hypothetical protein